MQSSDLFEEIRTLLQGPQTDVGASVPLVYSDVLLTAQVRSALRHLTARGLLIEQTMDTDGTLSADLDDKIGVLVALRVASTFLRGDLVNRCLTGGLGVLFQMGSDILDTKTAAIQLKGAAAAYDAEYDSLFTLLRSEDGSVFGDGTDRTGKAG